jgi:hypothetical protein
MQCCAVILFVRLLVCLVGWSVGSVAWLNAMRRIYFICSFVRLFGWLVSCLVECNATRLFYLFVCLVGWFVGWLNAMLCSSSVYGRCGWGLHRPG